MDEKFTELILSTKNDLKKRKIISPDLALKKEAHRRRKHVENKR
jgi:hypothetical protein